MISQKLHDFFPHAAAYSSSSRAGTVQESSPAFGVFPWQERHLQCLWADRRHRPAGLMTTEGEPVEVEHPGEWNLEAGPDFRHAVLRIGRHRRRVSGDLEIHIHAEAWRQHGHDQDTRYSDVLFHIVYFPGAEIPGLIQIPLQAPLSAIPHFSFENIDTTAYPYAVPTGGFPLKHLHPDRKTELLEAAGEERLRLKAERLVLAMQRHEPEQVLWEELLAALGYKNNKAPFRQLAGILPIARLRALAAIPTQAYALLLGLSGLLPNAAATDWPLDTRAFVRMLWDFWWKQPEELKEQAMSPDDWNRSGLRPINHPIRRMMAAAHYAFRIPDLLYHPALLTDFPEDFWATHLTWRSACSPTALVGQPRADAMITNILTPFQAACSHRPRDFRKLPAEPLNSICRQTAHALFGPDHPPGIYRSALARQGLIQIFHDYLITHRIDALRHIACINNTETTALQ